MKKFIYTIIFLIFIFCFSFAQENNFPFFEDYFNNNSNGWKTYDTENVFIKIQNGKLEFEHKRNYKGGISWIPSVNIDSNKDFYISFNTTYVSGQNGGMYGILWGANDKYTSYYELLISSTGDYKYVKQNKTTIVLSDMVNSPLVNDQGTNKIEIKKRGNKIEFYINGNKIYESKFESFFGNNIGFTIDNIQRIHFDDLEIGYLNSLTELIKLDVQDKINNWQQKGEFEKSNEYKERVNESTRTKKIEEYQAISILFFKSLYFNTVNFNNMVLGAFDADNECFLLSSQKYKDIIVPVPLADAPAFKEKFENFTFHNPDFAIQNDKFVLSYLEVVTNFGKKYIFNIKDKLTYSQTKIQYKFDEIELDVNDKNSSNNTVSDNTISVGKSDVDIDIPENKFVNDKTFAVIIGNENYKNEIKVKFAINDSKTFKKYLEKTLGIPKNNIHYIENGTYGQILGELKWASDVTKAYNGKAKIIFYYAGHGMPEEQTKNAFILPIDGNSQNIATAIKLTDIYNTLTQFPSVAVTVFLDACFSGSVREINGAMLVQGRGVKTKPNKEKPNGNTIVFSATSSDETAFPFHEKQHGLFTYFLLKKLQETKGEATLNELSEFIISNVAQQSIVVNKKPQIPQVISSDALKDSWQSMKLK